MPKRLKDNLDNSYFEAANALRPRQQRRRIVAYVESYDDIYFWRTVFSRFENDTRYFEVMLPSHRKLARGKKSVLMNIVKGTKATGRRDSGNEATAAEQGTVLGPSMIACVDADYDYLMQGATPQSKCVIENP